jgi:hypothetical protein
MAYRSLRGRISSSTLQYRGSGAKISRFTVFAFNPRLKLLEIVNELLPLI